jgi:hypothetical protein
VNSYKYPVMKLYSTDFYRLKEFRDQFTTGLWIDSSTSGRNLGRCEVRDSRSRNVAEGGSHVGQA